MTEDPFKALPDKDFLRPRDVADFLDVSLSTIYELINDGEMPHIPVGRQKRISRSAFKAWYKLNFDNGRVDGSGQR